MFKVLLILFTVGVLTRDCSGLLESCLDIPRDIIMALDSSDVITPLEFQSAKSGLQSIFSYFNIGATNTRLGFVTMGNGVELVFNFQKYLMFSSLSFGLLLTKPVGGSLNVGDDFIITVSQLAVTARPEADKYMVLIIHSQNIDGFKPTKQVSKLLDKGFKIILIVIGTAVPIPSLLANTTLFFPTLQAMGINHLTVVNEFCSALGASSAQPTTIPRTTSNVEVSSAAGATRTTVSVDLNDCKFPKDIVIILDGSDSISQLDFDLAKETVINLIKPLNISNDNNRVAFVLFSETADLIFNLDTYSNVEAMVTQIRNVRNVQSFTGIGKALNLTVVEILPKMRTSIAKLVFLFTDGSNNVYPPPFEYAQNLKSAGVQIVTVGIGKDINSEELTRLSSKGLSIQVDKFQNLFSSITETISKVCPTIESGSLETCTLQIQDLIFVLDTSDSIIDADFALAKQFVKIISMKNPVGKGASRVALVTFANVVKINFNLDNTFKPAELMNEITNAGKVGDTTAIGKALDEVRKSILPLRRQDVPFNVILMTDGMNDVYPNPKLVVPGLKAAGANIVAIGISNGVNVVELNSISSKGKAVTVENYQKLLDDSFIESVYNEYICKS